METAVEWLLRELVNKFPKEIEDLHKNNQEELYLMCGKATEIFEQQIIEAFDEGSEEEYQHHINAESKISAEQYYNKKFKNK